MSCGPDFQLAIKAPRKMAFASRSATSSTVKFNDARWTACDVEAGWTADNGRDLDLTA